MLPPDHINAAYACDARGALDGYDRALTGYRDALREETP